MGGQVDQGNLVGTTLGQYEIVELIGEGGMATVYKAWQPSLRRYVALKVLAPHLSDDAEFVKRFHQEAVSAANLKHTHIVTIHDVGAEGGYHFIAMEFIEGTSLDQSLRSGQAFAPDQVVDVISQVGSALDYAHQRGFIHRDVKPANVLVDASGRAVLTDFGIVKALGGSGVTSPLTQAGTVFGTPQYMSPEQIKDEPLDHRSDLYALGIVCYEMLSGQVPFDGTTTHSILYAQVNNPPPPLREFSGLDVPPPVEVVVEKMLAKERGARYDSAGEFARDLAQAVAGVWPAGMGGETAVVGGMGTGTAVIGGTPPGIPAAARAATVRQPMGPPTPPATVWQPPGPPTPAPVPSPARRSRWPLILGVMAVGVGVLLILAVVGVLVLGIENPLTGIQVARDLKDAQAALDVGDYAGASEGFSQALEGDPESVEATDGLLEAAANLAQAGQFDDAIGAYGTVLQAEPGEVRALRGLGQAYAAKGEWGGAAEWYEKWTQAAPEDGSAFLALGSARFNLGEVERTVAAYERAGTLGASSAEMDAHLGLAYFELAQHEEAAGHLQDAVRQTPEDFQLKRALGLAYFELARYEEASGHLQNAVDQDAEDIQLRRALGLAYFELGRHEEAIGHLQDTVGQYPEDFHLQRALGLSLYNLGQPDRAVEHLNHAVVLGADRPGAELMDVYYALGGYYFGEQDYEQAINFYEQAQELDPDGMSAWAGEVQSNLSEAYSELALSVMEDVSLDLSFSDIVTEGEKTYAVAKTGQRAEIEGAVRVVDGPWEGSRALVVEEGTTNLIKNPSFEDNVTNGWSASDPALMSVTKDGDHTLFESASCKISGTADDSASLRSDTVSLGDGETATGYCYVWRPQSGGCYVALYDATNGAFVDTYTAEKTSEWERLLVTWRNDTGSAVDLFLEIRHDGNGYDEWVDGCQLEKRDHPTSYCDGAQGAGHTWSGTEHNSTSTRAQTRVSIGDAAGLLSENDFYSIRVVAQMPSDAGGVWPESTFNALWNADSVDLMLYYDPNDDKFKLLFDGGVKAESSVQAFSAGDWIDVTCTFDYSNDSYKLYVSGQLEATHEGDRSSPELVNFYLGSKSDGGYRGDFTVAEFAVFGRVLNKPEVTALAQTAALGGE